MVKAYKKPAMRKLGMGYAYITVSTSNPAQRHITTVLKDPLVMQSGTYDVVCSCMGWTRHKHCWHADEAFMQSDINADETMTDLEFALAIILEHVPEHIIHGDTVLTDLLEKYSDGLFCAFCGERIEASDQQCRATEGVCKP